MFLAHAPYTLNPAASKPETREFALAVLADDLLRMENTPASCTTCIRVVMWAKAPKRRSRRSPTR